jgi:hypothetical protein
MVREYELSMDLIQTWLDLVIWQFKRIGDEKMSNI